MKELAPFRDSLQMIAKKYPDDKLIAPLVKQHLTYVDANMPEMQARTVVLAGDDPAEIPFTLTNSLKKKTEYRKVVAPYVYTPEPQQRRPENKPAVVTPKPVQAAAVTPPAQTALAAKPACDKCPGPCSACANNQCIANSGERCCAAAANIITGRRKHTGS